MLWDLVPDATIFRLGEVSLISCLEEIVLAHGYMFSWAAGSS